MPTQGLFLVSWGDNERGEGVATDGEAGRDVAADGGVGEDGGKEREMVDTEVGQCLVDAGSGLGEGVRTGEDRAVREGEVGEGSECRQDGSTEGVVGEVEVGEALEAAESCWDVAREGVPSEGEHREASSAAKGEGDDAGDGDGAEVEDGEGGQELGAEPVRKGLERRKSSSLHQRSEVGVVALVDGDAEEEGGRGVLVDMEASSGRTEDLGHWERSN